MSVPRSTKGFQRSLKRLDKVLSLLGLCKKAGKLAAGSFAAEMAVKDKKAALVLVAKDASENTKKLFSDKGGFRSIPVLEYGTKEELGRALGAQERAVAAVLDSGFAASIEKSLKM